MQMHNCLDLPTRDSRRRNRKGIRPHCVIWEQEFFPVSSKNNAAISLTAILKSRWPLRCASAGPASKRSAAGSEPVQFCNARSRRSGLGIRLGGRCISGFERMHRMLAALRGIEMKI